MARSKLKAQVLSAAGERLQAVQADLRERIGDLKSVTVGDENAESASQTESRRGSDIELMNSLSEQLEHVQREMSRLDLIDADLPHEKVEFGSVVHTNVRDLLVATSIDEFKAGGRTYLGLSPRAPLFQALQGKTKGERVTFNGVEYSIEDIY